VAIGCPNSFQSTGGVPDPGVWDGPYKRLESPRAAKQAAASVSTKISVTDRLRPRELLGQAASAPGGRWYHDIGLRRVRADSRRKREGWTVRALALAVPTPGHVNPLLPLTQALLEQGHEVAIACGEDPSGAIAASGASHFKAGGTEAEWFATFASRVRGVPGDGLAPERINHYFVPRLFADIAASDMIDDVLDIGRRFSPDVVLFEPYAFAAPLAAEILGVPAVQHLISPMMAHEVMELANDALSPLWRSFGSNVPGWGGVYAGLTIEVSPRALEPLSLPSGESILLRPAPLPLRPRERSEPPLVYVTLGTVFSDTEKVFRTILEGLEGEEVDVVITVGSHKDPGEIGAVPANTRVEQFIPQADLLPFCSVVVHHGGAGTMFGALSHGVPQVVVPQGADNYINAEHLERCGVGLSIIPQALEPPEVRRCVRRVLNESSFQVNANQVQEEIAAMPSPDDVARTLAARFDR
jgi:UDP:flavonoid glycosyltransferase YjiC (YdhE family)